jgi:hypothetical protein
MDCHCSETLKGWLDFFMIIRNFLRSRGLKLTFLLIFYLRGCVAGISMREELDKKVNLLQDQAVKG